MGVSLKLVSLNIEYSKHVDSAMRFLADRKPDVACIQELYERDVPRMSEALGSSAHYFVPMTLHATEHPPEAMGIAIFSRHGIARRRAEYYLGDPDSVPTQDPRDPATFNKKNQMMLFCEIEKNGATFTIGTTHFTWTPDGQPTDSQRTDMRSLLRVLEAAGECVFCGDFNVPRGGELWAMLASCYTDNVPPRYTTSIDGNLHRRGQLNLMVDGLFSTPQYAVSDVEMISGVSDHCALVATVSTAQN